MWLPLWCDRMKLVFRFFFTFWVVLWAGGCENVTGVRFWRFRRSETLVILTKYWFFEVRGSENVTGVRFWRFRRSETFVFRWLHGCS